MSHDITGITVVVQIDGKTCLAPIRADAVHLFMGMLPAFQRGGENGKQAANLIVLPSDVEQHILAFGAALGKHFKTTRGAAASKASARGARSSPAA